MAFKVKERQGPLDDLVFASPQLRVTETAVDSTLSPVPLPNIAALQAMLADLGPKWSATIDLRTGRPTVIDGGAIPWIPGPANTLAWESFGSGCRENACIPVETVEAMARQFMARYPDVFLLDGLDLVLDPDGSGPVWNSIYLLRFQPYFKSVRLQGASVYFRINNGNLIQVAVSRVGKVATDADPMVNVNGAWQIMYGYIGGAGDDAVVDNGTLEYIPVTPKGSNPEVFSGQVGGMLDYELVWRIAFQRKGSDATWEGLVDAHTGDLLAFRDANRYGNVHGGIRPSDGLPPEENRPLPYADINGNCAGPYSNSAGNFTGNSATSTLCGKYARVQEACGAISNTTSTGDLSFLVDNAAGTDCVVPVGNTAGLGNTHSARTLFYNSTAINLKAQTYNPANAWLKNNYVILHANNAANCNAGSSGLNIYFYKHVEGTCNNLGEIPGIAMHEWAHSYDDEDGSGGMAPPLETYADWTAIIQTHNSCAGAGFHATGNCTGYGNPCTACTGIRECDYAKHSPATPWTSALHKSLYTCGGGSYYGPCGWEDHCESGISTQTLWDFVNRDLTDASPTGPMYPNALDLTTAWMLEDRLWFTGVQTLDAMYTCSDTVTDGCAGNVLYAVMRALDDDGDGTANGTPHAHAIYHALHRHGIDCSTYNDASPQNQNQTSCPALNTPTVSTVARNNQAVVSWTTGGANATRYFVYRNESGCNVAFMRIATVTAPALTYTDNGVVNGTAYYYRVQAATANDACVSPGSACVSVTPQPCAASVSFDRTVYRCTDTVNVTVLDSTVGAGVSVKAWSSVDATQKTIMLTNTPPGSATYIGHFHTVPSGAGADQVNVANGATLTVRFTDPDYCGTLNQNVEVTAPVDCAGPVISNVQVINITESSATVTWTTNEAANSRVTYGTSTPPGTNKDDLASYVTSHSMILSGLMPCTQYYFSVYSADPAGNAVTDTNGGTYYTFTASGWTFALMDDMESGVNGWTATGLWHQINEPTCTPSAASPTHGWYFGVDGTCTYDTGAAVSGRLVSPAISAFPAGTMLTFKFRKVTEDWCGNWDRAFVQISTNGGSTWQTLGELCTESNTWADSAVYDLSAYAGSAARIGFFFDSGDKEVNAYLGWMVDDVWITQPDATACPTQDGWIKLDADVYSCSSVMTITLQDSDLVETGTHTVEIFSTVETVPEIVTLIEDGVFKGSFTTTASPPVNGDGLLSVADGAVITVRYIDEWDGHGGTNVPKTDTAATDCQPLVISNVQVTNILPTSATVTWITNEAANSRVTYGTSMPPGTNQDDLTTYATSHSVTLMGLTPCTDYYFSVTSADPPGNSTTDTNGGAYYHFKSFVLHYALGPDDVEGGAGNWVASGNASANWAIDTCKAHSGTHAWQAMLPGCLQGYGNNADTYLTYAADITLGAVGHGYHMKYWEYYQTESGYDYCRPQISTDGGTTWTTLAQYSGRGTAWAQRDYDLAAYTGSTVRVRFWLHTDASGWTEGWYVDDIEISAAEPSWPHILYQGRGAFTQITGDGDANLEPGEKWSVAVTLVNSGCEAATNVAASLSGNGIAVCNNPGTFGAMAGIGGTAAYAYEFVILPTFSPCGGAIAFGVIDKTSTEASPAGPDESAAFTLAHVGQPVPGTPVDLYIQPSMADTYVDQNAPDTNYGTAATMDVRRGAGQIRRSLAQFDISGIPPGATINSATLVLYATVTPPTTGIILALHHITGTWTEADVTWNTLPPYYATAEAWGNWTTPGYTNFNLLPMVQAWYAGTYANHGFLLKHLQEGDPSYTYTFSTRESATNRPGLVVNYTPATTYECSYVGSGTCAAGGPKPVPDGRVSGTAMRGAKVTSDGVNLSITYDTATCAQADHSILYGLLTALNPITPSGGVCGIGNSSPYSWNGSPAGNIWWVIVGDNGTTESSWGQKMVGGAYSQRSAAASAQCGNTAIDTMGTCP